MTPCLTHTPQYCRLHQCMIAAAQHSNLDVPSQLTGTADHEVQKCSPSSRAVHYLGLEVVLHAFQQSPGLSTAHSASLLADVGVLEVPQQHKGL